MAEGADHGVRVGRVVVAAVRGGAFLSDHVADGDDGSALIDGTGARLRRCKSSVLCDVARQILPRTRPPRTRRAAPMLRRGRRGPERPRVVFPCARLG
jgi:hypothetical protein